MKKQLMKLFSVFLVFVLFVSCIYVIEKKNKRISELESYMFYGCNFEEYSTYGKTSTYFDINEKRCKVEIVDEECMSNLNMTGEFQMELNSSNCITIYEINGTLSKRVY